MAETKDIGLMLEEAFVKAENDWCDGAYAGTLEAIPDGMWHYFCRNVAMDLGTSLSSPRREGGRHA